MLQDLAPEQLVIGPRPGKKSFERLSQLRLTHCCTLLGEKEQPETIEKISRKLGCEWVWLPVAGGGLETLQATPMADHIAKLNATLAQAKSPLIYLHCSAGLHRTGYVAYIFLRLMGLGPDPALDALRTLRPITADEVGEERIGLAEAFVQTYTG